MKVPIKLLLPIVLVSVLSAEEADEGIRFLCRMDASLCPEFDTLKGDVGKTSTVDTYSLSHLYTELMSLARHIDAICYQNGPQIPPERAPSIRRDLMSIRLKLDDLSVAITPKEATAISKELLEEEQAADDLIGESNEQLPTKLASINSRATLTWDHLRALGLEVDYAGPHYEGQNLTASGRLWRDQLNPLEERVAGLRDRLHLIAQRTSGSRTVHDSAARAVVDSGAANVRLQQRGLTTDPFARTTVEPQTGTASASNSNSPTSGFTLLNAPKTLLDTHRPPSLTQPSAPFEIVGGKVATSNGETWNEDAAPETTALVRTMHALGVSKTIGDPAGRTKYVFQQTGGTCGLASQALLYAEIHGIEPTTENMQRLENDFFERARRMKMIGGNSVDPTQRGTSPWISGHGVEPAFMGDMLDVPVRKTFNSTEAQLIASLQRGKMVQVGVNAGKVWNNHKYDAGGHALLVTGAEVNKVTGQVLGFYLNDTGSNEGGRFISREQFFPAWQENGGIIVEPL